MFKFVFLSLLGVVIILAYAGVQPLAGYKDVITAKFAPGPKISIPVPTPKPHGTYTAEFFGGELATITFQGDTLTTHNRFDGRKIYKYRFVLEKGDFQAKTPAIYTEDASRALWIWSTNCATDNKYMGTFRYVADQDIVILWGIEFYKVRN